MVYYRTCPANIIRINSHNLTKMTWLLGGRNLQTQHLLELCFPKQSKYLFIIEKVMSHYQ